MLKNLLFIIVACAIYFHFFPNSEFSQWFNTQKETAVETLDEVFNTKARSTSRKLFDELKNEFSNFTEQEIEYLDELSSSRQNIKQFNQKYCGTTKRNPDLRDKKVDYVCEKITQFNIL